MALTAAAEPAIVGPIEKSVPIRRRTVWLLSAVALATASVPVGIHLRLFRGPYPALGKHIAWALENPDPAYNFDTVLPGRLYRSARPDARFLSHLQEARGLERVVSLTGESEVHAAARSLGLEVTIYGWGTDHVPPRDQLETVLRLFDGDQPLLVHCGGGSDRTGYAVALYRVTRQGWTLDAALAEMTRYGHNLERNHELHREMQSYLERRRS